MRSSRSEDLLDQVGIASPCTASWEAMAGDDRVRFCRQCSLNVYNLSGMTKLEAEDSVKGQLVKLRYFTGLTEDEAASVLGISRTTAQRHWRYAKVWLLRELRGATGSVENL